MCVCVCVSCEGSRAVVVWWHDWHGAPGPAAFLWGTEQRGGRVRGATEPEGQVAAWRGASGEPIPAPLSSSLQSSPHREHPRPQPGHAHSDMNRLFTFSGHSNISLLKSASDKPKKKSTFSFLFWNENIQVITILWGVAMQVEIRRVKGLWGFLSDSTKCLFWMSFLWGKLTFCTWHFQRT